MDLRLVRFYYRTGPRSAISMPFWLAAVLYLFIAAALAAIALAVAAIVVAVALLVLLVVLASAVVRRVRRRH